eukprot:CAMPEP_0178402248 /NCGR_PEP_ID=MMETSP0689_2-20121128/16736_1 /TAXON_ID=160604 /ORGANISM="Amphidinium massartii, Strain CS-259" /LENGTH=124 /DNA_ID=CAMNT_0020023127 /DNA_START=608 /DNA_END=982 /DNA_ORIENTATION=+
MPAPSPTGLVAGEHKCPPAALLEPSCDACADGVGAGDTEIGAVLLHRTEVGDGVGEARGGSSTTGCVVISGTSGANNNLLPWRALQSSWSTCDSPSPGGNERTRRMAPAGLGLRLADKKVFSTT